MMETMQRVEREDYGIAIRIPDGFVELRDDRRHGQLAYSAWRRDGSHVAQLNVWKMQSLGRSPQEVSDEALGPLTESGHTVVDRSETTVAGRPGLRQDLERHPRGWLGVAEPLFRAVGLGWVIPRGSRARHDLVVVNGAAIVVGAGTTRWDEDAPELEAALASLEVRPATSPDWQRVTVPPGGLSMQVPGDWERYPPLPAYRSEVLRFGDAGAAATSVAVLRAAARGADLRQVASDEGDRLAADGWTGFQTSACMLAGQEGVRMDYRTAGGRPRLMREYLAVVGDEIVVVGAGSFDWATDRGAVDGVVASLSQDELGGLTTPGAC